MLEDFKDYWLIVGGANVDVKGESTSKLLLGTSNPGTVTMTAGGVARNVAEHLARLGEEVLLYALIGEDADGEWLKQTTAKSGVATNGMIRVAGQRTGRYLGIHDSNGELITAVADMAVNEAWDESAIQAGLRQLTHAAGMFVDANLPKHVLERFIHEAKRLGVKIVADPVSVKKAEKWKGMLDGLYLMAPSIDETEVLIGTRIKSQGDIEKAAARLLEQGVQHVMITCGTKGVYLRSSGESAWLPSPKAAVRDVTGAGDAFTAGVMFAHRLTGSLTEQAAYGLALAGLVLSPQSSEAIQVNREALLQAAAAYADEARL
ncbi:carbohydrate kinase family protein [Brevibacillus sp. H7]|uniref:carbohydrate kinase family protein n=1 Tax=Brevibacillus sp. H7 TaxID=3349138 RepID=UPI0038291A35